MKILTSILLVSVLGLGFAQAKDKDYSASIETKEALKTGINQINISIKSKTIPVYNADIKLKVFQANNKIMIYKTKKVNKEGKYVVNVNLPQTGTYNYLLSYKRMGGVIHRVRGNWEIK